MSDSLQPIIDGQTLERVFLHGDLKQLTSSQKVSYYRAVCESVGLNPLTQPFQYLVLNGKEVLYARREATEQLRKMHKVSLTIVSRELVEGTYIVTCRATLPDGRTDESIGAKWLGDLKGEARANGVMTAETKSKRRVTLSVCGLGMLDESEAESIPGAQHVPLPLNPTMGSYDTVPAPPPAALEPPPPDGYVRVERVESSPTKTPSVTKFWVTFSTGEEASTVNNWLASLAQQYCKDRTPVRIKTNATQWGSNLIALMTQDQAETPPEPIPDDKDLPF